MCVLFMRRALHCIALLGCGGALSVAAHASEPGSLAPDFELPGIGRQVKLADYRGKVVYVDFWASWCGPCRQSFPWMNAMQAKYGTQGLQIIGVNVDTADKDAREFLIDFPATFAVGFDAQGATARRYRIKGMPTSVLIDAQGKIVFEHVGFNAIDKSDLENRIRDALKGGAR